MISLLKYNPRAKIIWAHNCGRSSAEIIRNLLTQHQNLICDLGNMCNIPPRGYGSGWPKKGPWTFLIEDGSGHLYPEMKELFGDFPDRFTIGMDVAHTKSLNQRNYRRRVDRFRKLLSELTPETARHLAYKNAEALFNINK